MAEENQERLKQELGNSSRRAQPPDGTGSSQEVQRLQVLLSNAEKDKSSLQFRADQMSKELSKLKMQVQEMGRSVPPANSRLSEIR